MSTELHPDFPVVSGDYLMTKGWRVALPEQFNRRIEDGSLVLWRPELTFWINVWQGERVVSIDEVLERLLAGASAERTEEQVERTAAMNRLTYELAEDEPDSNSVNSYVIVPSGYVQVAACYDSPQARVLAYEVIKSIHADAA